MSDDINLLIDIPRVHARSRPDKVAVSFDGRDLTYAEMDRRSDRVAAFLQDLGVKPGDRVAWLGRPTEAWYEMFFGVAKARACFAPINSRLAVPEIAFILQDSGADVWFVSPEFLGVAEQVLPLVDRQIDIIDIGGPAPEGTRFEALRDAAGTPTLETPRADDDVLQLYTSGTTGLPKGVRLSNANYSAFLQLRLVVEGFDYAPDDAVLILMPMFHVAGTNISFSGLAAGSRIVLHAEFVPARVLETMAAERVAHVFLAPVMINALLQTPGVEATDFSSLQTVCYGASPISEAVLARATQTFGCGFIQFFGMAGATWASTTLAPRE